MIHVGKVSDMARLARIHLSAEEEEKMVHDLKKVFTWVEELESLCLQAIEESASLGCTREDTEPVAEPIDLIMRNAPQSYQNFFSVPAVMEI